MRSAKQWYPVIQRYEHYASKSSALGALHMDLVSIFKRPSKTRIQQSPLCACWLFALSFQSDLCTRWKKKISPFPTSSAPPLPFSLWLFPTISFVHTAVYSFIHSFIRGTQQGPSSACRYCPHCRGWLMSRYALGQNSRSAWALVTARGQALNDIHRIHVLKQIR